MSDDTGGPHSIFCTACSPNVTCGVVLARLAHRRLCVCSTVRDNVPGGGTQQHAEAAQPQADSRGPAAAALLTDGGPCYR